MDTPVVTVKLRPAEFDLLRSGVFDAIEVARERYQKLSGEDRRAAAGRIALLKHLAEKLSS